MQIYSRALFVLNLQQKKPIAAGQQKRIVWGCGVTVRAGQWCSAARISAIFTGRLRCAAARLPPTTGGRWVPLNNRSAPKAKCRAKK